MDISASPTIKVEALARYLHQKERERYIIITGSDSYGKWDDMKDYVKEGFLRDALTYINAMEIPLDKFPMDIPEHLKELVRK